MMRQALGVLMIATPFAGIFAVCWSQLGFLGAVGVFGLCAVIIGLIDSGLHLVNR